MFIITADLLFEGVEAKFINSLRVMGEKSFLDIGLKKAINAGVVWGPRLICSGQNLTVTGGHADISLVPEIRYEEGLGKFIARCRYPALG